MRILDIDNDSSLDNISLLLTKDEAVQLIGYLEDLVRENNSHNLNHFHLNNLDYSKEITLSVYNEYNIDSYPERYKILIESDK